MIKKVNNITDVNYNTISRDFYVVFEFVAWICKVSRNGSCRLLCNDWSSRIQPLKHHLK